MIQQHRRKLCTLVSTFLCAACLGVTPPAIGAERPHGLEPAGDMPFIPDLGGLRNTTFKNQFGQVKRLTEGVVVRKSAVEGEKATVPAGGLFYISEVADDVAPFRRDPFLVLGEHAYLVDLKTINKKVTGTKVNKGEKVLLDENGYRLWFDYATDHYDLPYLQFALISPAGHWPLEFPISNKFPLMDGIKTHKVGEGHVEQIDDFYLDPEYRYGATTFKIKDHDFNQATFDSIVWPEITEATFSMSRPWVLDVKQEDFRWYGTKRIYASRTANGFKVKVTDWSGDTVYGEKEIRPISAQGYKDREDQKDQYFLSLPEQDMRIELMVQPEYLKHSDFTPWSNDVPYGWTDGLISLVVYTDLVTVKTGQPWPLDNRYKVGLEANQLSGKLQRLVLENASPVTFDANNTSYSGPVKYSDVWNRPAFTLNASDIRDGSIYNYYLRDAFYQRTDNMVFDKGKGRKKDMDFFVGRVPTFISVLESSFLTRLADTSYSTVVEPSHFTSFPKVNSNMAFHSPDGTAPFGGLMRGFGREQRDNRRKERLTSSEGLVIRGSYVDWRNDRIVIPPSGLFYTSRNARNVRVLHGESFYVLGKRAYIATFESTTFVRKNFDLDFWKHQPEGSMNPIFWQDEPLGVNNKVLRFTQRTLLDDRPMGMVNVVKYSGNNFGAPFLMAPGLNQDDPQTRYNLADHFAEGATWILPEFVGENYMRIKEFGTPSITNVEYTFTEPKRHLLAQGATAPLGDLTLAVTSIRPDEGIIGVELRDKAGAVVASKNLGPLNDEAKAFLPQHQKIVNTLQLPFGPEGNRVLVEMDILKPFENGQAGLWLYTGLEKLSSNTPLPYDNRFMVRPDVCGHCYQLNELLFDNPEPIILDKENPRFEGPKGPDGKPVFTIVLDNFDGEMVHGWHIEAPFRGRIFSSPNMAFNPRTNIDCLMGVNGTIEGFLRASLMERSAYQEYWRRGQHTPAKRGLAAWAGHKFQ